MKHHFGFALLLLIACFTMSCTSANQSLVAEQQVKVKTAVKQFADSIATGVSHDGPIGWLKYFSQSPDFFMASDGQLVFRDHAAAEQFITGTLIKSISKINLQWSNLRIDPLTSSLAVMATGFHEDLTDGQGKVVSFDGYFTAIAQKTDKGWQLRDAHWSIKH